MYINFIVIHYLNSNSNSTEQTFFNSTYISFKPNSCVLHFLFRFQGSHFHPKEKHMAPLKSFKLLANTLATLSTSNPTTKSIIRGLMRVFLKLASIKAPPTLTDYQFPASFKKETPTENIQEDHPSISVSYKMHQFKISNTLSIQNH